MIDLERDLAALGDQLALDGDGLVDDVLARIAEPTTTTRSTPTRSTPTWLVAAAVALAVVGAALVVPSSRQAIADWFGLDGVRIEQQPDLDVPADVELPVGVTVDRFDGSLDDDLVTKVLGSGTGIERVEVGDRPGLWIDGVPHELVVRDADGEIATRRFAGNTLLWQDGDTIVRLEGAPTLTAALDLAATLD